MEAMAATEAMAAMAAMAAMSEMVAKRKTIYIGRNAQNLKKLPAADQQQHTITIRAPVGANKL